MKLHWIEKTYPQINYPNNETLTTYVIQNQNGEVIGKFYQMKDLHDPRTWNKTCQFESFAP